MAELGDVFWFLFALFLHYITAFSLLYCFEKAEIWKENIKIDVKESSIYDLEKINDMYIVNEYVEKRIKLSQNYFKLRDDLERCQSDDSTNEFLVWFVTQVSSFLLASKYANRILVECIPQGFSKIVYALISLIGTAILCIIGYYIVKRIYESKLYIAPFMYDENELRRQCQYRKSEFPIPKDAIYNNHVIEAHYVYLQSIEKTVRFRSVVRTLFEHASGILYILLFLDTKYY